MTMGLGLLGGGNIRSCREDNACLTITTYDHQYVIVVTLNIETCIIMYSVQKNVRVAQVTHHQSIDPTKIIIFCLKTM